MPQLPLKKVEGDQLLGPLKMAAKDPTALLGVRLVVFPVCLVGTLFLVVFGWVLLFEVELRAFLEGDPPLLSV